jgi:hypothetical protein
MATKLYHIPETAVVFAPTGGTEPITMTGRANGAGQISDQYDRGTGAKPGLYTIQIKTKAGAALAVGAQLFVYLLQTSVAAEVPGNLGQVDATVASVEKQRNLGAPVLVLNADSVTSGEAQLSNANIVEIYAQYISVMVWNALGQSLSGTAGDHAITLVPVPPQSQ